MLYLSGVDVVELREDQYSVHHIRTFGLTNHLVLDAWNGDAVYFIDQHWNVRELKVTIVSLNKHYTKTLRLCSLYKEQTLVFENIENFQKS